MDGADPEQALAVAIRELLADGPMPAAELVVPLDRRGLLDFLREEDDGYEDEPWDEDELSDAIVEIATLTDEIWATPDDVLTLTAPLLDGLVLTHRVSVDELDVGELDDVDTDLGPIDLNREPLDDALPAWTTAGELVALRRRGDAVTIERVASLADDRREVAALRAAFEARVPPEHGEDAFPIVLDALASDPTLFHQPIRPVGELLVAAGLERSGTEFGRASESWRTFAERRAEHMFERFEGRYGFDLCCRRAFDRVRTALVAPFDAIDRVVVAGDLGHGAVLPAIVTYAADANRLDELRAVADLLVEQTPRKGLAAALCLRGLAAPDVLDAERDLQGSLDADPDFAPALFALAAYEIDRGDLRRAAMRLRHPNVDDDELAAEVDRVRHSIEAPYRAIGRNDPCPCGSGRKFKVCCQREPNVPVTRRVQLVIFKLVRFASERHQSLLVGVAASAVDPDEPDLADAIRRMASSPVICDFALFDGPIAEEYLDERGPLLPPDEVALIAAMAQARRRLWEITDVDAGKGLTLRDTKTGEVVAVTERLGSQRIEAVGQLILARVAAVGDEYQLIGVPIDVPLRLRDSAIELVDSDPDADELAEWYGASVARPKLMNAEREPLMLCTAELTTGHDPAALRSALDPVLRTEPSDDGLRWAELVNAGPDEELVRGTVRYESGRLIIDANSVERFERLIATVTSAVADAVVVSEERVDPRRALRDPGDLGPLHDSSDLEAIAEQYIRQKEVEWIDESIPGLGGMTPRQALDDPTRRSDLLALLREWDARPEPASGRGFDADRIRSLLGIDG